MCNCGGGSKPAISSAGMFRPQAANRLPVPGEVSFLFDIPNVRGTTSYVGTSGKRYNVSNGQTWLVKKADADQFAAWGFGRIVGTGADQTTPASAGGEFQPLNELQEG